MPVKDGKGGFNKEDSDAVENSPITYDINDGDGFEVTFNKFNVQD